MKLEHHLALATVISGLLYVIFKSGGLSIASLLAGIFIDVDHIYDYIIARGRHINPGEVFTFFYNERHRKITLFLHGWEWLFCLSVVTVLTNFNPWVTGGLIGYGHHIVFDYLYSKASLGAYSLIWRWKKKFDSQAIFPRDRGYNPLIRK